MVPPHRPSHLRLQTNLLLAFPNNLLLHLQNLLKLCLPSHHCLQRQTRLPLALHTHLLLHLQTRPRLRLPSHHCLRLQTPVLLPRQQHLLLSWQKRLHLHYSQMQCSCTSIRSQIPTLTTSSLPICALRLLGLRFLMLRIPLYRWLKSPALSVRHHRHHPQRHRKNLQDPCRWPRSTRFWRTTFVSTAVASNHCSNVPRLLYVLRWSRWTPTSPPSLHIPPHLPSSLPAPKYIPTPNTASSQPSERRSKERGRGGSPYHFSSGGAIYHCVLPFLFPCDSAHSSGASYTTATGPYRTPLSTFLRWCPPQFLLPFLPFSSLPT